ncbi:MAG: CBO0543 family protein [Desulfotomaculaceae bacterium]
MQPGAELTITVIAAVITLLLLIFAVDWRHFRDWVVIFLFKTNLDLIVGNTVVKKGLISYPERIAGAIFDTSLLFEIWVFPVLCILYNQVTRKRGLWPIFYYAVLFSAGITAVEYPLELYTDLIEYTNWHWYDTLLSLAVAFLVSRVFIAFYRWGCLYFDRFI